MRVLVRHVHEKNMKLSLSCKSCVILRGLVRRWVLFIARLVTVTRTCNSIII